MSEFCFLTGPDYDNSPSTWFMSITLHINIYIFILSMGWGSITLPHSHNRYINLVVTSQNKGTCWPVTLYCSVLSSVGYAVLYSLCMQSGPSDLGILKPLFCCYLSTRPDEQDCSFDCFGIFFFDEYL